MNVPNPYQPPAADLSDGVPLLPADGPILASRGVRLSAFLLDGMIGGGLAVIIFFLAMIPYGGLEARHGKALPWPFWVLLPPAILGPFILNLVWLRLQAAGAL